MKQFAIAALALLAVSCGSDEPAETSSTGGNGSGQGVTYPCRLDVTVTDYSPAPGQFVNELPLYEEGDTHAAMTAKADAAIAAGQLVSLGALGGSITMRLPEPLTNHRGADDLRVLGNSFAGNGEPGIVMVSADTNGNGLPDDEWFTLAGEDFDKAVMVTVTYAAPFPDAADDEYIAWTCTPIAGGTSSTGYLNRVPGYHSHSYMPSWLADAADGALPYTYTALMLPPNGYYDDATLRYILDSKWGYADSYANSSSLSALNLDNAVDRLGNHADIAAIDFVRVVTAILQANGPLGECSTEVCGVEALHP